MGWLADILKCSDYVLFRHPQMLGPQLEIFGKLIVYNLVWKSNYYSEPEPAVASGIIGTDSIPKYLL